jgi:hypothetical protein
MKDLTAPYCVVALGQRWPRQNKEAVAGGSDISNTEITAETVLAQVEPEGLEVRRGCEDSFLRNAR